MIDVDLDGYNPDPVVTIEDQIETLLVRLYDVLPKEHVRNVTAKAAAFRDSDSPLAVVRAYLTWAVSNPEKVMHPDNGPMRICYCESGFIPVGKPAPGSRGTYRPCPRCRPELIGGLDADAPGEPVEQEEPGDRVERHWADRD